MMLKFLFAVILCTVFKNSEGQPPCTRAANVRPFTCARPCVPSDGCSNANHDCLCDDQCGYSCVRRGLTCGTPPTVRFAVAKVSGTLFNDTVVYTCRRGYTVIGATKKRCNAKGRWGGSSPFCMGVCTVPKTLPFGAYVKEPIKGHYQTGNTISLRCKKGFKQQGKALWFCIGGTWTNFPFKCIAIHSCRRTIRAAFARCTQQCYPLGVSGCPPKSKCLCDGQCGYSCVQNGLSCGDPPAPDNGFREFNGTGYNDTVIYRCEDKFTLTGNPVRRCTAKKSWEGMATSCLPDCAKPPQIPANAYIENEKENYASGDRLTFKCKKGYNQEGLATMLCFLGNWNIMPFKCEKGGCGDPGVPENGNKVGISYGTGRKVLFTCKLGFEIIGSDFRRCGEDNQWSGTQPECRTIHSCRRIIRAAFTRCTQACSPIGVSGCPPNSKCLCDGQCGYSCVQNGLSCGDPPAPDNGFREFNGTGYNDTVIYRCEDKFTLTGNPVRRCTAKKSWEGMATSCLPDCAKPPQIPANAYIENEKENYASGDRLTFKCKKGYNQEGLATMLCFLGNWNIMPFKCEKGGCGDPGVPENGNKVGISYGTGRKVFFTCKLGFEIIGSDFRRCGEDNQWSGTQPKCRTIHSCRRIIRAAFTRCTQACSPIGVSGCPPNSKCLCDGQCGYSCVQNGLSCGDPPAPNNGFREFNGTGYNDTVTYRCKDNFTLAGNPVRRCTAKKSWEGMATSCLPDCAKPHQIPANAYIENEKERYASGDRVTLKCKKGYNQEGLATILCFLGNWNVMPFKCEKGCGYLGVPENGNKLEISFGGGRDVFFTCKLGFNIIGSDYRICGEDNKWSGTQPECRIVDCGVVQILLNGTIIGTETTFQKTLQFQCDPGFELIGSPSAVCQSDGRWSNKATCDRSSQGGMK